MVRGDASDPPGGEDNDDDGAPEKVDGSASDVTIDDDGESIACSPGAVRGRSTDTARIWLFNASMLAVLVVAGRWSCGGERSRVRMGDVCGRCNTGVFRTNSCASISRYMSGQAALQAVRSGASTDAAATVVSSPPSSHAPPSFRFTFKVFPPRASALLLASELPLSLRR